MTKKQPANDQGTALRVHWTIEARAYIEYSTCALTRSDRRRAQARWRRQSPRAAIFTMIQSAKIDDIDLQTWFAFIAPKLKEPGLVLIS